MKKIVLMLAAVLAVSSVSAFANKPEATKEKKATVDCHDKKNAENEACKHHEKAAH